VYIQKGDPITLALGNAIHIAQVAADLLEPTDRHVARDQRIRDSTEPAFTQMHIGAADFAELDSQQCRVGFQLRVGVLSYFYTRVWLRNDSGPY
jgi:hypothetical protein